MSKKLEKLVLGSIYGKRVCPICGARIGNPKQHAVWHVSLAMTELDETGSARVEGGDFTWEGSNAVE